jgi:hypothetical protein
MYYVRKAKVASKPVAEKAVSYHQHGSKYIRTLLKKRKKQKKEEKENGGPAVFTARLASLEFCIPFPMQANTTGGRGGDWSS